MTLIGQAKLASRVREEVRDRIRDGRFSDGVQLPPEVELATSLGVSRTTVREALLQLEQEGLLIRRHGHGTFVRSAARLRGSLNANISATEVIKGHGMEPGTSHARVEEVSADEEIASILGLAPGAPVLRLERVRTADGRPVIFTVDVIPTGSSATRAWIWTCCSIRACRSTASTRSAWAVRSPTARPRSG